MTPPSSRRSRGEERSERRRLIHSDTLYARSEAEELVRMVSEVGSQIAAADRSELVYSVPNRREIRYECRNRRVFEPLHPCCVRHVVACLIYGVPN